MKTINRSQWREAGAVDWVLVAIAGIVGLMVLLTGYGVHRRESVTMSAAYAAWCKLNGNSNALTYDEWRALVRASESPTHNSTAVVPIVVPVGR